MKRNPFLTTLSVITICLFSFVTESCKTRDNSSDLSRLTEKHLVLAEFNGKPLSGVYTSGQEPQLILRMIDETSFLQVLRSAGKYAIVKDALI